MAVDIIKRIQTAVEKISGIQFAKVSEQRLKTIVQVNSADPAKTRKLLSMDEFAGAISATVVPMRKTKANGFSIHVEDARYGKPVFIRIRKGGVHASGIKNEHSLLETLQDAVSKGVRNIVFRDKVGGSIAVKNAVSVRSTGNDPGSRTGNRADIEITDAKGVEHRFSLKMDNASKIAGLKKFLARKRLAVQRNLRTFLNGNIPRAARSGRVYVSVQIRNPRIYNFCWFGNDIDKNGGVVVGTFKNGGSELYSLKGNTLQINCTRAFSPNDDQNMLMSGEKTSAYILMELNPRTMHMEFSGAFGRGMAGGYELKGFEIEGISNPGNEEIVDEDLE